MKILILTTETVLGGHVLSALTIARGLKQRGHEVIFAGGPGKLLPTIQQEMPFFEVKIPIFHDRQENFYTYFTWDSFRAITEIQAIIRQHAIEMIHAFDARVFIPAQIAGLLTNTPVTCTLCGGTDPLYNIPLIPKLMVFSEEQKQKMVKRYRWHPQRVEVVRTRLAVSEILAAQPIPFEEVASKFGVLADRLKIMMISSFDPTKIESVRHVLEAVRILLEKGLTFQMVFIGGEGDLYEDFKRRAAEINQRCGQPAIVFTGPMMKAYRLLVHADIVFGVGRSAFEGMLYEKPTAIVGARGFAGIVSEETVADIAYYNFSGRNQQTPCPPQILAERLEYLLTHPAEHAKLGQFGKQFVMREIDVELGLARIEEMYRANMAKRPFTSKLWQWLSVVEIMIPIWRDNFFFTLTYPMKKVLGRV